jgi:hypothetical protein
MGTPWSRMLGIWLWLAGFEVVTDAVGEDMTLEPSMSERRLSSHGYRRIGKR